MITKVLPFLTLAGLGTAQYVSEPFAIRITGKTNSSIDGYVGSCHAGAAIEGLCFEAPGDGVPGSYNEYYLNTTSANGTQGLLIWELPLTTENGTTDYVPSAMTLGVNYGSNVAVPLFYPGYSYSPGTTYVSVSDNGTLFLPGGVDDSNNNATYPSPVQYLGDLTNWNLCYQFTGGYYYYSIAWVFTQPAQNPSCQPVQLMQEPIAATESVRRR
ncbi:hypothetical protein N0V93_009238 [Gnomoniopsis smithogilvyi]|uniref:DUF7907 domain-containing protein n=1 Tax=Gnomoniopsis smithogilvyi TaxID=1191159 RepID=A0A9W8YLN2_9PEZI|nr:hypothetical protein N0V93_009238 [Gnomoniopsis smithogilvyi]